jgi:DNA (cytosine-5)-methyltransferase 1
MTTLEEKKYNVIDLFAGTGAFSYVFSKKNQFNIVFSNDIEKESKSIIELNYHINNNSSPFHLANLNDFPIEKIPKHDILCGGFPCQPFSICGEKKGFDDERSNVFWKMLDIIKYHHPQILLLENVKNLVSHDKGNTFKVIYDHLSKLGYFIKYSILDTCKITEVPHHRERIYIICFKNKDLF